MVGQRGVLGPRVRQHSEALVDQALVVQLLERPHDRLHEVGVHGLVAVVEVDPARLAGDVLLPLVGVLQHGGGAVLVELGQAHVLDLALVGDAQLLLRLELGGQAVAVPAEHAVDLLAAHGLVARDDVLDVARQQVAVVRQAVGERRAVVEDVLFVAVALVDRRLEGSVGAPEVEDAVLQGREAGAAGHVAELVGARVGAACGGGLVHVGPPWSLDPGRNRGKCHGDACRRGTTPLGRSPPRGWGRPAHRPGCAGPTRPVLLGFPAHSPCGARPSVAVLPERSPVIAGSLRIRGNSIDRVPRNGEAPAPSPAIAGMGRAPAARSALRRTGAELVRSG